MKAKGGKSESNAMTAEFDAVLKRMLATPPDPKTSKPKKKPRPKKQPKKPA